MSYNTTLVSNNNTSSINLTDRHMARPTIVHTTAISLKASGDEVSQSKDKVDAQNIGTITGIGSKLDIKDGVNNLASGIASNTKASTRLQDTDMAIEASGLLNAQVVHQSAAASSMQQATSQQKSLLNLFA